MSKNPEDKKLESISLEEWELPNPSDENSLSNSSESDDSCENSFSKIPMLEVWPLTPRPEFEDEEESDINKINQLWEENCAKHNNQSSSSGERPEGVKLPSVKVADNEMPSSNVFIKFFKCLFPNDASKVYPDNKPSDCSSR